MSALPLSPNFPADWPTMGMVCRFSLCRKYRFTLWRETGITHNWFPVACDHGFEACPVCDANCSFTDRGDKYLQVIGLNPSTADETENDPTIRRCIDFAKRWGFRGLCMTNLFAFRATDPDVMKDEHDPVGNENDHHLLTVGKHAGMVLAAWGNHGSHRSRASTVINMFINAGIDLHALRKTKTGHPQHPLYIPADTTPILYP